MIGSEKTTASTAYWEAIHKMTPEQKLEAAMNLYWTAREFKAAGLRMQFPHWNEDQVQAEVRKIFLYAND